MQKRNFIVAVFCLLPIIFFEFADAKNKIDFVIRRPIVKVKKGSKKPTLLLQTKQGKALNSDLLLPKISFLHKERQYDQNYLKEYRKMIRSLLPEASMYDHFGNREFLPLEHEIKTIGSRYSASKARLPVCSSDNNEWTKVKVLQLEKSNSVTLKENRKTGVKVVEKLMKAQKHYDRELNFFSHAHHGSRNFFPALICSKKAKNSKDRFAIVTDYVKGEKSHVMAAKASMEQLRFMVAQFFNSVVELHKIGYIHCDLTPANVMVSSDFEVKLIDFGIAVPIGKANGYRGSIYTRAPELHRNVPGKIDVSIDWWAFGATVAMWYYYHFNPKDLKNEDHNYMFTPMKLKNKAFHSANTPENFPADLRKFLSLFLTIDPELRTFSTVRLQNMVKNHEFFNGFNWSTAEKS
jgi:serine/threonine protein kinase